MKKILGILLVIGSVAVALNFSGHQSINGLRTVTLFKSPQLGYYFIKGNLSLPNLNQGSSANSEAVVLIKSGATTLYSGITGAKGFGLNSVHLSADETVTLSVTSAATVDQGLNVIKGDIFFGNK